MPSSITVCISERDILKIILEFLENHHFHIAQLSLEREAGVINGDYSEDILFLRQLILDGQWDNAIDFVAPLKEIADFDIRNFRYFIMKYKYYELLCIKQEPGFMHDNDFAVEEIVECLKELEDLCSSSEEFRRLCALLTLKKLSDHEDLKSWNPSSARIECFYKILPLVSDLLQGGSLKKAGDNENSINDRLLQLVTKGILYEGAVDYCQNQALEGKNAPGPQYKFNEILLPKQKLSSMDLSLVSWLEVLGDEQFTIPFQQKALDFKMENMKKPKLEAQWTEQILATPIKPGGQFPHSLVPHAKLKCAQKMSQSMIMPSGMSSSIAFEPYTQFNKKDVKLQPMSQSTTAALSGFSINVKKLEDEATMRQSQLITNMLENTSDPCTKAAAQSNSSGISVNSVPTSCGFMPNNEVGLPGVEYSGTSMFFGGTNGSSSGISSSSSTNNSRRELDAICRRNQSIAPSSMRGASLPPVPELPTPGSSSVVPSFADHVSALTNNANDNPMIHSRLFQEFSSKNNHTGNLQTTQGVGNMVPMMDNPHNFMMNNQSYNHMGPNRMQGTMHQQNSNVGVPLRQDANHQYLPYSNERPVSMIADMRPQPLPTSQLPLNSANEFFQPSIRPKSFAEGTMSIANTADMRQNQPFNEFTSGNSRDVYNPVMQNILQTRTQQPLIPPSYSSASMGSGIMERSPSAESSRAVQGAPENVFRRNSSNDDASPLQFVPLCRYEDSQAIRAVAFHPSGKFFAIGTNSKQMLICKYPDIRRVTKDHKQGATLPNNPEILLSRPKQHRGSVYCCGFNPSGELLATGSNDKTLRLMAFNADECKIGAEMELMMHDGTVRELIFMEDTSNYSSIVVSGGAGNCHICLTDCTNGRTFKSFTGHTAPILGLYSWGPGTSFASCSQDKTIRFWDLRASSAVNVIVPNVRTSNSPVTSVCVDPSGKLLVSGHEDASVMLYDIIGGRVVQTFRPHGDEVRTVRCSNAAYYLLSGSYDKRVVITDIRGDLTAPLTYLPVAEHTDKVIQCRWHPQDFTFLSTSADRTAVLWSLPQPI